MKYTVIIEKDEDGIFVAKVPEIQGCHTQGSTLDELIENIKEAIQLCLEYEKENKGKNEKNKFIGIQQVEV